MAESLPAAGGFISNSLKTFYRNSINRLIADGGRTIEVWLPPSIADCPNCFWSSVLQRSANRYDSSNPNTLNGTTHKPFDDGQICPVCNGRGLLNTPRSSTYTALISTKMNPEEISIFEKTYKDVRKTITVVESFLDLSRATHAIIDGDTYKLAGKPKRTGPGAFSHVVAIWGISP
jgi:hypothetical protein